MSGHSEDMERVLRAWGSVDLWEPSRAEQRIILREREYDPVPVPPYLEERDLPGVRYVSRATVSRRRAANKAARKARRAGR